MRVLALLLAAALLAVLPAVAGDRYYDSGAISFSYVQTPFPEYSGTFEADGEALLDDGSFPPGADQAVGGATVVMAPDTVTTGIYAVIANPDGTFDGALVALRTDGPLTPGSYPVDIDDGTAVFGYIDDAEAFDLPQFDDLDAFLAWIQDLPAAHKLISTSGTITVTDATADTLAGTFSGTTVDLDNFFFIVNVNDGQFALSGGDIPSSAPDTPLATAPVVHAWPNPFNPRTSVTVDLAEPTIVDVAVFDLAGRRISTLHRGALDGSRRLDWDGTDQRGDRVPAGVYLVRAAGQNWRTSTKVTLAP